MLLRDGLQDLGELSTDPGVVDVASGVQLGKSRKTFVWPIPLLAITYNLVHVTQKGILVIVEEPTRALREE